METHTFFLDSQNCGIFKLAIAGMDLRKNEYLIGTRIGSLSQMKEAILSFIPVKMK